MTDNEGNILLILRVVTNSDGEPIQKIGLSYTVTKGKSLDSYLNELGASLNESMSNADIKKLLKERFSCFSNPMNTHLIELINSSGLKNALETFRQHLMNLGKAPAYLTMEEFTEEDQNYLDFHPMPFSTGKLIKDFPSFNDAADEYFSKIERQKARKVLNQQITEAENKLNAIKSEQQNRIRGLEQAADKCLAQADAINANEEHVANVIKVIEAALEAGMDWKNLEYVIECEKNKGNPTAMLIKKLKLETIQVEILLNDLSLDIDVRNSPLWNATKYYEMNRTTLNKLQRTKKSLDAALRSAEKKIKFDLSQNKSKVKRQQVFAKRKHLWFEKFNWFISSDNFLVICGKDMQQNELLVKRYLKEGDVYVHADIHGAASVIVKGRKYGDNQMDVPPRTLSEAGTMSLCFSKAWESKIVTSAWWVYAKQVSKTAQSGEYLPTGSFMIRGKKNFLPPSQLVYGFGFMFALNDEAKEKRRIERLERDQILIDGQKQHEDVWLASDENVDKYMSLLEIKDVEDDQVIESTKPVKKQENKVKTKRELNNFEEANKSSKDKNKPTRGSKGKQKKIAKKYADQDEEERQLRLQLLASKKEKPVQEVKKSVQQISEPAVNPKNNQTVEVEHVEQGEDIIDEEEKFGEDETAVIDALVGDIKGCLGAVQCAIPVCGPISALTNYTFRVKLVPGSLKRGKAVQQAVSIVLSEMKDLSSADVSADVQTEIQRQIKDMVKAVPDADLNSTMLGHVKIMARAKEIAKIKSKQKNKK